MIRARRNSDEAPEVVPQQQDLFTVIPDLHLDSLGRDTYQERQSVDCLSPVFDTLQSPTSGNGTIFEAPTSVSSPREIERDLQTLENSYDPSDLSSYGVQVAGEPPREDRRVRGLHPTIFLIIFAFLIGGAIGGGIGGGFAAANKNKLK